MLSVPFKRKQLLIITHLQHGIHEAEILSRIRQAGRKICLGRKAESWPNAVAESFQVLHHTGLISFHWVSVGNYTVMQCAPPQANCCVLWLQLSSTNIFIARSLLIKTQRFQSHARRCWDSWIDICSNIYFFTLSQIIPILVVWYLWKKNSIT